MISYFRVQQAVRTHLASRKRLDQVVGTHLASLKRLDQVVGTHLASCKRLDQVVGIHQAKCKQSGLVGTQPRLNLGDGEFGLRCEQLLANISS